MELRPCTIGNASEGPERPPRPQQEESMDSEYELNCFEAFRQYCVNANIALVRPTFLEELCAAGGVWPRRQEAEQIPGALYKPGPHDEFSFIGISHCWESREHPDPFGYQLSTIVDAWHYWREAEPEKYEEGNIYFFIDYMSLPQFKRSAEEQKSFQRAMKHMHLFYANSGATFCKSVWRLGKLTPPSVKRRQICQGRTIPVYIVAEGKVVEVPLKRLKRSVDGKCGPSCDDHCRNLHANDIVYLGRGWCRAEYEWAKPNTVDISRQGVCLRRCCAQHHSWFYRFSLPWTPEAFQRNVSTNTLKFTHRSDIKPVIELQRKVFDQKVATLEKFECNWLPCHEVEDLLELLPLLGAVQEFWLTEAYVPHSQQLPLANALARRPALQKVLINSVRLEPPVVQVLADVPQLRTLRLFACGLGDAGAGAVAAGLTQHAALQEVWLECNGIGDLGAEALAKALESNHVLELLDLQLNHIRSSGAIALAEALRLRNEAMRRLVMRYNPMDAQGVQALRRAVAEKESLDVDHEGLERNAESSYCGWMFCVLLRVFVWIVVTIALCPMKCFVWRQRVSGCIGTRLCSHRAEARHEAVSDDSSVASMD